jgi:hypothetical protein
MKLYRMKDPLFDDSLDMHERVAVRLVTEYMYSVRGGVSEKAISLIPPKYTNLGPNPAGEES